MAKKARTMTTEDVMNRLDLDDDYDDFDEPMPGSEDEFSDCDEDENGVGEQTTPSSTQQPSQLTGPSTGHHLPSVISTPQLVLLCPSLRQLLKYLT